MAINSDIRDHAYQFFIEEAPELFQLIESGLLNIRQEKSTAKVHDLMRAAHSLKGGSASVGLDVIATLAHRLENIFKALYSETLEIDTDLESQLLVAYDCLHLPLMEQIREGYFDPEQALTLAEPIFAQIEERLGDAIRQTESYLPSSSDLGIDITQSIFEVDVGQGLEHLAAVVAQPQDYEIATELRAQAEVFAGFAELLNQPALAEIAATTISALDAHPEYALAIAQLALTDFQVVRQAVLSGTASRTSAQTITPSAALIALADTTNPVAIESMISAEPTFEPTTDSLFLLEDIFGDTSTTLSMKMEEIPVLEATEVSKNADRQLEEIFTISPEFIVNSEELTSIEDANADEYSIINRPETLEATLQSIEHFFDRIPLIPEAYELISDSQGQDSTALNAIPLVHEQPVSEIAQINQIKESTNASKNELHPVSTYSQPDELSPTPQLSVRVDYERLGRMNNLVGELAINRNGLSLQNEQLQGAVQELLSRFNKVQKVVGHLQNLSDTLLVNTSSFGSINTKTNTPHKWHSNLFLAGNKLETVGEAQSLPISRFQEIIENPQKTVTTSHFDSLELDSYGVLHSRLQGLLEEMMQLEESVNDIILFAKQSDQTIGQQRQMHNQLRDELMWARMLPLSEILNRFPRMLRDLSTTHYKPVSLKLSGTGVLVDKAVLEKLYDPLLHLLRNAFDHGIESPEIRRQKGKPEQGQIEIRAYYKGSHTVIEIKDDGQGLNLERILTKAIERGLLLAEQLENVSSNRLYELIFEAGFSTASQVSELSGRGVGLDVVRSQMRSLKGTISVNSSPGIGTTFILRLPLTLTIAKLLVCFVGSTALALPSDSIEEIVVPKPDQIQKSENQLFLQWREQLIPTYVLADFLNYNCPLPESSSSKALTAVPAPKNWALPMLIFRQDQQFFALEVDSLVTEQELVIKPFGTAIAPPICTYGCTILGDGSLIPVIDAIALLEKFIVQSTMDRVTTTEFNSPGVTTIENSSISQTQETIKTLKPPTILVVDDAAAMRRTLALTLERVGYRVLQARDGQEALAQLQQNSAVELVICDIEMPNMNGFEFLSSRRQEPQLLEIPVVMLTSRSNDKHRWLAMQLGATSYFTKPYLEQEFLGEIEQILA